MVPTDTLNGEGGVAERFWLAAKTKSSAKPTVLIIKMVGAGGLEPPTFSMSRKRSNQLSYAPVSFPHMTETELIARRGCLSPMAAP